MVHLWLVLQAVHGFVQLRARVDVVLLEQDVAQLGKLSFELEAVASGQPEVREAVPAEGGGGHAREEGEGRGQVGVAAAGAQADLAAPTTATAAGTATEEGAVQEREDFGTGARVGVQTPTRFSRHHLPWLVEKTLRLKFEIK